VPARWQVRYFHNVLFLKAEPVPSRGLDPLGVRSREGREWSSDLRGSGVRPRGRDWSTDSASAAASTEAARRLFESALAVKRDDDGSQLR
jgi:hypothetical protein